MKIGIIGGTGLYQIDALQQPEWIHMDTPFGAPSDDYRHGMLAGVEVFFLPRHARGHRLLPSEINHRANIYGFKTLGVERIISVSAVGSLREDHHPRDVVLPDQYFDRTKRSADHTFFGHGIVAHIPFGAPVCPELHAVLGDAARAVTREEAAYNKISVHQGGTYVNMEGPAFSTRAESFYYRHNAFDVIGMTSLGEAKLCREAEICYAPMTFITDYDCWHEEYESVTIEIILGHLHANTRLSQAILLRAVNPAAAARGCGCGQALAKAIVTAPELIPAERKQALRPIIGKYVS